MKGRNKNNLSSIKQESKNSTIKITICFPLSIIHSIK